MNKAGLITIGSARLIRWTVDFDLGQFPLSPARAAEVGVRDLVVYELLLYGIPLQLAAPFA